MEDMELDIVTFEDDGGNTIDMQVLDYMFYEGKEYAILTEYKPDEDADETEPVGVLVMEVVAVEGEEDMEEFVPISDELGERLVKVFESRIEEADDDDEEDEDEE